MTFVVNGALSDHNKYGTFLVVKNIISRNFSFIVFIMNLMKVIVELIGQFFALSWKMDHDKGKICFA